MAASSSALSLAVTPAGREVGAVDPPPPPPARCGRRGGGAGTGEEEEEERCGRPSDEDPPPPDPPLDFLRGARDGATVSAASGEERL